ncbi:MAG: hypothetical protein AMXMBFR44_5480 [Candidatus Campbellbacteria bacterium]
MQRDSKNTIIAVLVVLLVIVSGLWLREMNKPAGFAELEQALIEQRAEVDAACVDTTTEAGRETCMDALQGLRNALEDVE